MKIQFTNDNRGVSEVIGAILVFGLLIALMAIIQTQAVPAANQQVEFDHNQEVQGDLAKFHERVSRVAVHGSGESVSIQAGTGYPSRMLFFNPPRATGAISSSDAGTATLENVSATNPEVRDYLSGSNPVQLESRTFEYRVDYNEFEESPISRYEYGILYNEHRNASIIHNSGSVIDDTNINLVFMMGNYSKSSGTTQSVDVEPVSAPARPVTVTGEGGQDIVLTLPTDMPIKKWKELYGDQSHVRISNASGDVQINLDGDRKYTLRMAGIGLESGISKPSAHYIVPADDGAASIGAGDTTNVKYEVRDEYNNPVSGVNVTIDYLNGTSITESTNGDGRVTAPVAPDNPEMIPARINDSSAPDCSEPDLPARCETTFAVQVADLNPNPSAGVILEGAESSSFDAPLLDLELASNQMGVRLNSTDGDIGMEQIRINHYHPEPEAHSPVSIEDETGNTVSDIEIGGAFEPGVSNLDKVSEGGSTYIFTFNDPVGGEHYMVFTVVFENGQRSLYFASPG